MNNNGKIYYETYVSNQGLSQILLQNMKKIDGNPMTVDFELLWGRIHKLLINALQVENDAVNTQILLGEI